MRKRFFLGMCSILLILVMAACSFGANDVVDEMDTPPTDYSELDQEGQEESEPEMGEGDEESGNENENENEAAEQVQRKLYLIDANGMVVPQTMDLPKTESVLRQSLEYLVDGGPITEMLPSGFSAVIPAGTEVDVHLAEGVAIADFSNEFKEYNPDMEQQILQAITWTLTEFDNVDKVQIKVNGYLQETMPVGSTPIGDGVSRENGINIETGGLADMVNSKGVTLYFLAQNGDNTYYVPVTRRVKVEEDSIEAAVSQLIKGPSIETPLLTDFRQGVELIEEPQYQNGVVTLNFNEGILSQLQSTAVSATVLDMLALTLTEQEGIEKVAIEVEGDAEVLNESGQWIEEVVRPEQYNIGAY
ncbi:GerMN domain-containing protein [Alkalihalobacillus hemicellulosilyticus]|uniref:Germination (Cortex hydrolysis) and sporulation protein GerM n=1 Tax=Halalkalibacter hemicellulosilyticusJCM 9152 TaxID=1236971 RepID=W4QDN9_9BACI|nr:GerMN domain-containing protein [Halalkalibacter hemicellulosilyticus]GAE30170.1 germination (cortex hydrolysis) and sporulation protein GerM [Halalkalibacter hemicellulosilyticusJCM 9152]